MLTQRMTGFRPKPYQLPHLNKHIFDMRILLSSNYHFSKGKVISQNVFISHTSIKSFGFFFFHPDLRLLQTFVGVLQEKKVIGALFFNETPSNYISVERLCLVQASRWSVYIFFKKAPTIFFQSCKSSSLMSSGIHGEHFLCSLVIVSLVLL